MIAGMG
jgi:hypothetical protein